MIKEVIILNKKSQVVYAGTALCDRFERDSLSGCKIATCHLDGKEILVWKYDDNSNVWQGWL